MGVSGGFGNLARGFGGILLGFKQMGKALKRLHLFFRGKDVEMSLGEKFEFALEVEMLPIASGDFEIGMGLLTHINT